MSTLKENIYLPIIAFIAFLVAFFGKYFLSTHEYWRGIAVELGGVFWEVFLITVILGFYEAKRRRKDKIQELNRRINDFKRLDDGYSKAWIGSSLRELKKLGVTAPYDFRGMQLSNFSFDGDFEVSDISGSTFSDGLYLSAARKNSTRLKNVIFNGVDCKNVVFNKGGLSLATYENCFFCGSNLAKASFCGARLEWSRNRVIENEQGLVQ